jgi:hypothetical protein
MGQRLDPNDLNAFLSRKGAGSQAALISTLAGEPAPIFTVPPVLDPDTLDLFPDYAIYDDEVRLVIEDLTAARYAGLDVSDAATQPDGISHFMKGADRIPTRLIREYLEHGDFCGIFNQMLVLQLVDLADRILTCYFRQLALLS